MEHKSYKPRTFAEMTEREVELCARRVARRAGPSIRIRENGQCRTMTMSEIGQYARAVAGAILYFNLRDAGHVAAMRYRKKLAARTSD